MGIEGNKGGRHYERERKSMKEKVDMEGINGGGNSRWRENERDKQENREKQF